MAYNWIKMLMDIRNISIEEMAEATSLSTHIRIQTLLQRIPHTGTKSKNQFNANTGYSQ